MGKVLKAVAVIAIAVAVAYFAPQLLPALIGSGALASAVAAAIVSTAIATAVTTGLSLLAGKPHTSTAPGAQSTRGQPQERDGFAWRYPPPPAQSEMAAVGQPWWRDGVFYPWQRRALRPISGSCMQPVIPAGRHWVIVDRDAPIGSGDLFLIRPGDLRAYMRANGGSPHTPGLVKRFLGVEPESRVAVFETTNPPNRIETGLDRIEHAYRVVSLHPTLWAGLRAYWIDRPLPATPPVFMIDCNRALLPSP